MTPLNMRGDNMTHDSTLLNSSRQNQSTSSNSDHVWQGWQGKSCNRHWHPVFKLQWLLASFLYLNQIVKVQGHQSFTVIVSQKAKMQCVLIYFVSTDSHFLYVSFINIFLIHPWNLWKAQSSQDRICSHWHSPKGREVNDACCLYSGIALEQSLCCGGPYSSGRSHQQKLIALQVRREQSSMLLTWEHVWVSGRWFWFPVTSNPVLIQSSYSLNSGESENAYREKWV